MKTGRNILEFLLPEMGVYSYIKKYGFIQRKKRIIKGVLYTNVKENFNKDR